MSPPGKKRPLRLMVYDDTCRTGAGPLGLTHSWIAGALLYRTLGRLDAWSGARSWEQALSFLVDVEPDREISEIQYWGHGRWGNALLNGEPLDRSSLEIGHKHHELLAAIRARLTGPNALWWFRTCETFGATSGQRFAREWTEFLKCRAAGHTFIIGPWQSGLHSLKPGERPSWSVEEGLLEGTSDTPRKAAWSGPGRPNTISCLRGTIPASY